MTFKDDLIAGRIKKKDQKDAKYLGFVRSLPCVISGQDAEPHHLMKKGYSGMGKTASDYLAYPLCRAEHDLLHENVIGWEERNGHQFKFVVMTQAIWINKNDITYLRPLLLSWEDLALDQMQRLLENRKR